MESLVYLQAGENVRRSLLQSYNCFLRNTCPTISTMEKLCAGLNISLSDFFGYKKDPLRDTSLSEDEQNLLNAYRKLSIRDKELLSAYLDGLSKKRR